MVLAGCSGGPDSLALAAALAFEAAKLGYRAGAVTVDHGLQEGSAHRAGQLVAVLEKLGLDPVLQIPVEVARRGDQAGYQGPEAAARQARYAAFESALTRAGAGAIMLGHTLDDQAETVLLGLARGSGARSLAGMAPVSGRYLRPFLSVRREDTAAACAALGLMPWHDPQNHDQAFRRTRVRDRVLPLMEELIGPGVAESLARTADQLRTDADLLDSLASEQVSRLGDLRSVAVSEISGLPDAIRRRVLKRAALGSGVPAGSLTACHVADLDALVTDWRGQQRVDLPGGVRCERRYGRLRFTDAS